jgi:hypothetical protein
MTRVDRIRQRREMHRRIRAVVAERRSADRTVPYPDTDDDEEPTLDLRVDHDAVR